MRIVIVKSPSFPRCNAYVGDWKRWAKKFRIVAAATIIILAAHSITRESAASNLVPVPEPLRGSYSAAGGDYDCSAGGRIGQGEFNVEGVKSGINGALKLLEDCPACRQFYGKVDPVDLLNKLVKTRKVIVTKWLPRNWKTTGPPSRWPIGDLKPWDKGDVSVSIELSPIGHGGKQYLRPCIYINPAEFMVTGGDYLDSGNKGLSLDQARVLVILHELAHCAGVIPYDGDKDPKVSAWKSVQNTLCVRRNCFPCAEHTSACKPEPFPHPVTKPSEVRTVKNLHQERNRQ